MERIRQLTVSCLWPCMLCYDTKSQQNFNSNSSTQFSALPFFQAQGSYYVDSKLSLDKIIQATYLSYSEVIVQHMFKAFSTYLLF